MMSNSETFSAVILFWCACGSAQYFADRDVFCAGRVMEEDLKRVASATGGSIQTTVNNIVPDVRA